MQATQSRLCLSALAILTVRVELTNLQESGRHCDSGQKGVGEIGPVCRRLWRGHHPNAFRHVSTIRIVFLDSCKWWTPYTDSDVWLLGLI